MFRTIVFIFLLVQISPAYSQAPELLGKTELSLHGDFDFQGPNGDNIDLRVSYGWFKRDDLVLSGIFQWALMEDIAPGINDYRSQQVGAGIEYLLLVDTRLVPYLGAEIGYRSTKFDALDESALVLGGSLGLRYFLTDSVSLNASIKYLLSDKEVFAVDFEASDDYLYPSFGINASF